MSRPRLSGRFARMMGGILGAKESTPCPYPPRPAGVPRPTPPAPPTGRQQPDVSRAATRALAEQIAADLMTNPGGTADRLVLTSQDGRDMGGWARGPLEDRIEQLLRGER